MCGRVLLCTLPTDPYVISLRNVRLVIFETRGKQRNKYNDPSIVDFKRLYCFVCSRVEPMNQHRTFLWVQPFPLDVKVVS